MIPGTPQKENPALQTLRSCNSDYNHYHCHYQACVLTGHTTICLNNGFVPCLWGHTPYHTNPRPFSYFRRLHPLTLSRTSTHLHISKIPYPSTLVPPCLSGSLTSPTLPHAHQFGPITNHLPPLLWLILVPTSASPATFPSSLRSLIFHPFFHLALPFRPHLLLPP